MVVMVVCGLYISWIVSKDTLTEEELRLFIPNGLIQKILAAVDYNNF
jgi:hypothetical protein